MREYISFKYDTDGEQVWYKKVGEFGMMYSRFVYHLWSVYLMVKCVW